MHNCYCEICECQGGDCVCKLPKKEGCICSQGSLSDLESHPKPEVIYIPAICEECRHEPHEGECSYEWNEGDFQKRKELKIQLESAEESKKEELYIKLHKLPYCRCTINQKQKD
tara:strand:- start:461 stop:802 length:342 start_codon:yes stop_codon:yes gene_type:complete